MTEKEYKVICARFINKFDYFRGFCDELFNEVGDEYKEDFANYIERRLHNMATCSTIYKTTYNLKKENK